MPKQPLPPATRTLRRPAKNPRTVTPPKAAPWWVICDDFVQGPYDAKRALEHAAAAHPMCGLEHSAEQHARKPEPAWQARIEEDGGEDLAAVA